jgi:hypothetical protein
MGGAQKASKGDGRNQSLQHSNEFIVSVTPNEVFGLQLPAEVRGAPSRLEMEVAFCLPEEGENAQKGHEATTPEKRRTPF